MGSLSHNSLFSLFFEKRLWYHVRIPGIEVSHLCRVRLHVNERVWFRVSARYDRDKPRIPPNGLRPTRDGRLKTNAGGRFPKRGLGGASLKRGRAFVSGGTKHGQGSN